MARRLSRVFLAALSRDEALASAGRGADLYAGIAELARMKGVGLTERSHAKVGMLAISTAVAAVRLVPCCRMWRRFFRRRWSLRSVRLVLVRRAVR